MTNMERQMLSSDVEQAEGFRATAYQDTVGVWTVGFGTNLQELTIDRQTAAHWLAKGLVDAEAEATHWPWYPDLSGPRQAVIVELIYNMGRPRLSSFVNMLAAIARDDFESAATHLLYSKYARQVPGRAQRLARQLRTGVRAVS